MSYTVRQLIDLLEDVAADHGDGVEVRLASQPNWPFEYSISNVEVADLSAVDEGEEEESNLVVYIAEGTQLGYLPTAAARVLNWRD